jgi:ketosteroid isomerase-like protein
MSGNTETIANLYTAFANGDVPTVLGAFAPDIRWAEAEGFPYGGTYIGPDAVLSGVFMRLGSEWDGYAAVPDEIIASGETVIALGHYSGTYKATGKYFRAPMVHVWRFRDGKVASFQQHTDTVLVQRALT